MRAFNPDGALNDANNIAIAGNYAYITTAQALVIVSINDPLNPRVVNRISLKHPRSVAIQFRYAFVVDDEGLKVIDVTVPEQARLVEGAVVPLAHAHDVYVARTYAYVANGKDGIAIIDVEQPERPRLDQMYNAEGKLNDVHQVKIAMTNASLFAYVADGKNGMRILQLTSPETMPEYAGFSPRPRPVLIATFKTKGEALGVSKALDRDRAVDESGNQVSVFGRRGARPFTYDEMLRMLRTNDGKGEWFRVSDKPQNRPQIRDPDFAHPRNLRLTLIVVSGVAEILSLLQHSRTPTPHEFRQSLSDSRDRRAMPAPRLCDAPRASPLSQALH